MAVIESSPQELAEIARQKWSRENYDETAVWKIPGESSDQVYLLIHGFRGDHHGLAAIAAGLTAFDVLIPDLPGYGKSAALENSDLESYSNWLVELVRKIGKPVHLIGHSFGTLVCSQAVAAGLQVLSLSLIAPISTRSAQQKDLGNSVARVFYRTCKVLGLSGSLLMRSWLVVQIMSVAMATTRNRTLRSWIHNQHQSYFSNYANDEVVETGFWSASKSSVLDFADRLKIPTLIISGDIDLIAPLDGQKNLQKAVANSKLEVIPNIGHLLHYEAPAKVAALISDFSKSV